MAYLPNKHDCLDNTDTRIQYPLGLGERVQHFVLHQGSEAPARALLVAANGWRNALHEEIYIFNSSVWQKDHALWVEVQKANWDDVILKDSFKTALQKDVNGFFESEDLYKSLAIAWKVMLLSAPCEVALNSVTAWFDHVRTSG